VSAVIPYLIPGIGFVIVTEGGVLFAEMMSVATDVAFDGSLTVRLTLYLVGTPALALKVCDGLACVLSALPSPKFQL
jgi:hypothetical protein